MLISLHKNATTTPATRLALQQATGTDRELAQQYGIGIGTVRKWRSRSTVHDASHTAHRLQTTLNAGQEELVIYLRSQLRLPLDDLLAVVREFIEPAMSRSALDRLLRRRGYSRLPVQPKPESEHKPFKAYEPGYVHVDVKYLPQMQDEDKRRYVFVAIDRATRWVFIDIKQHKTAASAKAFLAAVRKAAAFRIHTILTDNGKEFTDRLFGSRTRQPTGEHEFDQLCQALGIEHRLTKPRTPKTNGMVERFNGRLSQVLRSHHFNSAEDLEKTLHRFVWLYNHHLPQKALGHEAPVQALKKWKMKAPDLFVKNVRNHPGPDTQEQLEEDEFQNLVAEMTQLGFTHSSQVSNHIVSRRLGYKYKNISGILQMELDGTTWNFKGGFPPKIYARLCEELGLSNNGTRARAVAFESFGNIEERNRRN